ncbi:hypothetical protein LIER_26233 [Lithospermum erythrorhizon]|uniref:Transposase n=1 Tax=Lithospermum erythrorhizon TaxID=34254 RepID=A0AAV3RAN3_LITER
MEYLLPGENESFCTCKSKQFIPKVMFLATVARPWFDMAGNVLFDEKIGIFPFIFQEPTKRNNKNQAEGTLVTKPILSITQDVIRPCILEKEIPTIKEKWPSCSRMSTIYIQQDNARPHIDPLDDKFLAVAQGDGFDIRSTYQPPNSHDFNVLDLGYFRAIQSLQYREAPKTIDELVLAGTKSFEKLSPSTLNRIFLTFQECMIEVMKSKGRNNCKIPHMKKTIYKKKVVFQLLYHVIMDFCGKW